MSPGWTAVRVIRWPEQSSGREWCAARDLPRILLVAEGAQPPIAGSGEVVLPESVDEARLQRAVDDLAWRRVVTPAPVSPARATRATRATRRPRSLLGVAAALF